MTDNTELLKELVELRARNARLEEALKLATTFVDHEHSRLVIERPDAHTHHPDNYCDGMCADEYSCWQILKQCKECLETTPPGSPERSDSFADKVLKLAAAGLEAYNMGYAEWCSSLEEAEQFTPEEVKLLEGMTRSETEGFVDA